MRRIQRSALVPHSTEQMFDIVNDVGKYGEFLPWCQSAEVKSESESEMIATVNLMASGLRLKQTSFMSL